MSRRRKYIRLSALSAQSEEPSAKPRDVVAEIGEVARRVPMEDVTGAAVRSMLIGAIVVGALAWLARLFVGRKRRKSGSDQPQV